MKTKTWLSLLLAIIFILCLCGIPEAMAIVEVDQKTLLLTDIALASATVYKKWEQTGSLSEAITIGDQSLDKWTYFMLALKAIIQINAGNTDPVEVIQVNTPASEHWSANDTFGDASISKADYIFAAERCIVYMTSGNVQIIMPPDGIHPFLPLTFSSERALVVFPRVLAYYAAHGELPDPVDGNYAWPPATLAPTLPTSDNTPAPTPVAPTAAPGTSAIAPPRTGGSALAITLLGVMAMAAGAGLFLATRKRQEETNT